MGKQFGDSAGGEPALQPWKVTAADYPTGGTRSQCAEFLLRYGVLAPSSHNTQPWLFSVTNEGVQVRADRARQLPVVDPHGRELVISCGAAIETLRVAARHFGQRFHVAPVPDPDDADLLARLRLGTSDPPSTSDNQLFDAVTRRRTNRSAYTDCEVPDAVVQQLIADAHDNGAWLYMIPGGNRRKVADLVARGDAIQMADRLFRRELASWMRANRSHDSDGIRGYGFGFGDLISHVVPRVIRTFDLGESQAARDRALAESSPLLAVLGSETDGPRQWLAVGQALQRILLRCCAAGVSASFLNQPVEVEQLRAELAREIGHDGAPQLLLRFGYGPPVEAQPRHSASARAVSSQSAGGDVAQPRA